jgi:hypothetical protein
LQKWDALDETSRWLLHGLAGPDKRLLVSTGTCNEKEHLRPWINIID